MFNIYGKLHDGISRMRLKYHGELDDLNADVIGTIASTDDPTVLAFDLDRDTLPTNTIASIDKVIDPSVSKQDLIHYRCRNWIKDIYVLVKHNLILRGVLIFQKMISLNTTVEWVIAFDASEFDRRAYVTNLTTQQQFKFEDGEWSDTYQVYMKAVIGDLNYLDEKYNVIRAGCLCNSKRHKTNTTTIQIK